jgi:hypothetical protein
MFDASRRRRAGLVDRRIIQAVENRAEHHGNGDREHRYPAAAGGTLGELGIGLQFIVGAGGIAIHAIGIVGGIGTRGIVRIVFIGHDRVSPLIG